MRARLPTSRGRSLRMMCSSGFQSGSCRAIYQWPDEPGLTLGLRGASLRGGTAQDSPRRMSAHDTRILAYAPEAIAEAARLVAAGLPVAMPTETVCGLA